ncbi:MAG: hypothetical protein G01um101448_1161, partial [Parcubacteria group bacterium Gr01-1014_48]
KTKEKLVLKTYFFLIVLVCPFALVAQSVFSPISSTFINEREEVEFGYSQEIFGQSRLAVYNEWIIDSYDTDPAYNSAPLYPRHYFYRWNTRPYTTGKSTEKLFGKALPNKAVLYISDMPTQATYISQYGHAVSTSFHYKIGLYRSKDVPTGTTAENIQFAKPLMEFEWQNSWIYDHTTGTFQKKADISPQCAGISAL